MEVSASDSGSASEHRGHAEGSHVGSAGDDTLVPVPMPPLIVMLANMAAAKGSPLTREEVERIRDDCACMMLPAAVASKLAAARGYADINPDRVWEEWQAAQATLAQRPEDKPRAQDP